MNECMEKIQSFKSAILISFINELDTAYYVVKGNLIVVRKFSQYTGIAKEGFAGFAKYCLMNVIESMYEKMTKNKLK